MSPKPLDRRAFLLATGAAPLAGALAAKQLAGLGDPEDMAAFGRLIGLRFADDEVAQAERNLEGYRKDYEALRGLFGELLREVQRIKSQGDYEAAKALVEGYGVKVDQAIHEEVLTRSEALGIAPYGGFINPEMQAMYVEDGMIGDVKLVYPDDFATQMLNYSQNYGFLPLNNDYVAE